MSYQHRVIREKAELDDRLNRLRVFLSSPRSQVVSEPEIIRLHEQEDLMHKLSDLLGRRIEAFTNEASASEESIASTSEVKEALNPLDVPIGDSYKKASER